MAVDRATLEIEFKSKGVEKSTREQKNYTDASKSAETQTKKTKKATDDLGHAATAAGSRLSQFAKKVSASKAKLKAFGDSAQRVGRTMNRFVTLPILAIGAAAIKTAGDFEQSMNRVRALTGATGEAFEAMELLARDLGKTTVFTASQASEGMGFLAQAGFEVEKILGAMPATLDLAAAAQLDLGRTADLVSNIMSGFGIQADDLGGAVDVLTKTFISSNTNLEQLGDAMKFVAPVASSLGVSIEETAAAIGILSNAGLQGSLAGTGLRRVLSTLITKADRLGIVTQDAAGNLRPLANILDDLKDKGLTTGDALEIFGQRAGPAIMVLLQQGGGALRQFTQELEDAGGTAERVATVQLEGFNGLMKIFKSVLQEAAIIIGEELLPKMTKTVEKVKEWVTRFSELSDGQRSTIISIAGVVAAIGPLLIMVSLATKAVNGLSAAFVFLAANPVTLILGALFAVTAGLVLLGRAARNNQLAEVAEQFADVESAAGLAADQIDFIEGALSRGTFNAFNDVEEQVRTLANNLGVSRLAIVDIGLASDNVSESFKDQLRSLREGLVIARASTEAQLEMESLMTGQLKLDERALIAAQLKEDFAKTLVEIEKEFAALVAAQEADTDSYLDARRAVLGVLESEKTEIELIRETIQFLNDHPWQPGFLEDDRLEAMVILNARIDELQEKLDRPGGDSFRTQIMELNTALKTQLRNIDLLSETYDGLGIEYDESEEKSRAVMRALKSLIEIEGVGDIAVAALIEKYGEFIIVLEEAESALKNVKDVLTDKEDKLKEFNGVLKQTIEQIQEASLAAGVLANALAEDIKHWEAMARLADMSGVPEMLKQLSALSLEAGAVANAIAEDETRWAAMSALANMVGVPEMLKQLSALSLEAGALANAIAEDVKRWKELAMLADMSGVPEITEQIDEMDVALERVKDQLIDIAAQGFMDTFEGIGEALFEGADGLSAFEDGVRGLALAILDAAPMMLLQMAFAAFSDGAIPVGLALLAASGFAAVLKGGVNASMDAQAEAALPNASGNVFSNRNVLPFASGGVVTGPTLFPTGNGTGLMGEAGPEAIMPLRRMPDGNLGVQTSGGKTTVIVNNYSSEEVTVSESADGDEILVMVGEAVNANILNGTHNASLGAKFGLTPQGVR